jgi:hypothetical protein
MRVENAGVRVHCVRPRLQVAVCRASAAYELAARLDGPFADVLRLLGHGAHPRPPAGEWLPTRVPARSGSNPSFRLCRSVGRDVASIRRAGPDIDDGGAASDENSVEHRVAESDSHRGLSGCFHRLQGPGRAVSAMNGNTRICANRTGFVVDQGLAA